MRPALAVALVLFTAPVRAADTVTLKTPQFEATIVNGTLAGLKAGEAQMVVPGEVELTGLLRVGKDHLLVPADAAAASVAPGQPVRRTYRDLSELPGSTLTNEYSLVDGELVVTQQAASPEPGVHGVEWGLGLVPLEYNVLVPGNGGIRLQKDSPGSFFQFDYPIGWEAQFVILEGAAQGFCVWAEDAIGRYKRLMIRKLQDGWQLGFTTHNNAPFAPLKECSSVRWHVAPYKGDWRVPAKRYREWAAATWKLTPLAAQTPSWVKDIRFLALVGQDTPVLEALAKRVDPKQTLLYVPNWREFGYDRMYPDYTANDSFGAFVEKAHALGFRVMPHVNYFGCDPKSPEYATFEKYQIRSPWSHEREWWLWERADPVIKFAYISPACKAWRELQIARWKEIVEKYHVDAFHLDQTLCIYNDDNGLVDGMTMLEGNLAIQRELHEALPDIAISGEGLDEVTMRYEAFAQRHAYGLNFVEGTWDKSQLVMAHPVSAYLLNGYTQPYGYLGMSGPGNGQVYAAWRENYKHWGVIPTFAWPSVGVLETPSGFARQCLDEATCFTQNRLDADLDGPWAEGVCFPYIGANGVRAAYRDEEGGTVFEVEAGGKRREVSRIVTGATEIALPGSVPGWKCYNKERVFGLDPDTWYAYSPQPRDHDAFHVTRLPEGFTASRVTQTDQMAVVEVRDVGSTTKLTHLFDVATCGSKPFEGDAREVRGPLSNTEDGAQFVPQGSEVFAHPPWKAQRKNAQTGVLEPSGTGVAYASFPLTLPEVEGSVWFRCTVAMDKGAIGEGKTDGVVYSVTATAPGMPDLHAELLNAAATAEPLNLDLSALRGRKIALRLQIDPGPNKSATFDWARWYAPRVEVERRLQGSLDLAAAPFTYSLSSEGDATVTPAAEGAVNMTVTMALPGTLILLKDPPQPATLPFDLAQTPFLLSFNSADGQVLDRPQFASAGPAQAAVGGVTRSGLTTHPPDHGLTNVEYPMVLPAGRARFHCFVGLRDGSKSEGCGFRVTINGKQVAYEHKLPGEWSELAVDLSPWAGKPVVLSLVTDSEGPYSFDWAIWGEVRVTGE